MGDFSDGHQSDQQNEPQEHEIERAGEELDDEKLELLDQYMSRLQAGEEIDRAAFLLEFPELESALDCIEMLDEFASNSTDEPLSDDQMQGLLDSVFGKLPREFGDFELIEEIGRGGMGVVFRARQRGLDRMVAVKMILSPHLASEEHVRRFHAEAQAAARLHHPSIVHIHEVGQFEGQHFFVMEFIDGMSLSERIAQGALTFEETARIMTRVARACAYLHREGVIHRDLKPSNILLDKEGNPYLTDFGLAKVRFGSSDLTTSGTIIGTPSYMSPEQASGHSVDVGPLSDVYSLGAILYEMLTGQAPFREETPLDTLMKVITGEPLLPRQIDKNIPRQLQLIAMKCMEKSPNSRYASADAFADDLHRYLIGEAIEVRPPSLYERVLRWMRREPALAARLAVMSVFLTVETISFCLDKVPAYFHYTMLGMIFGWVLVWVTCQQLIRFRALAAPSYFVWGTLDIVMMMIVLMVAKGAASPLVLGLPMLVAASGLWLRERFVWMMTTMATIAYILLIFDYYFIRPYLQNITQYQFDRHVIFILMLFGIGGSVGYLVHRIRTLSQFCRCEPDRK